MVYPRKKASEVSSPGPRLFAHRGPSAPCPDSVGDLGADGTAGAAFRGGTA